MYMDDNQPFAKNEKELDTLIQAVRIYSQDIGIEYGIEKCTRLIMKTGKRHMTEGMELPNQGNRNQNTWRNGNVQIPGNIGRGHN